MEFFMVWGYILRLSDREAPSQRRRVGRAEAQVVLNSADFIELLDSFCRIDSERLGTDRV